jgi:hypothetical protein
MGEKGLESGGQPGSMNQIGAGHGGGSSLGSSHAAIDPAESHGAINPADSHGAIDPADSHGAIDPADSHGLVQPTDKSIGNPDLRGPDLGGLSGPAH